MTKRPSSHNSVIIIEAIDRALAAWEINPRKEVSNV